jgi:predicted AAA+ superfamily ATPase
MENLVLIELKKLELNNLIDGVFYYKDLQNEVDFVVKKGLNVEQLIQVSYASNKDEIERREIKGLQRASELLKCENLLIITWDYEDEVRIENKKIVFKPLWKWLLT